MARPRLLDLFCGGGGAAAGYHAAGFEVVGVDIAEQPNYPYAFIQADALHVDLHGFDVIHASPPCQRYCAATSPGRRAGHPDLVKPVRARLREAVDASGGPWAYVIENVPGAPMRDAVTVCGDTLRLGVRRHRLFESNLPLAGTPCWHDRTTPPVPVYGTYGQRVRRKTLDDLDEVVSPARPTEHARAAMGIDWLPWPALTQAIPPAYTHWLGVQLLLHARDVSPELWGSVTGDKTRRRIPSPTTSDGNNRGGYVTTAANPSPAAGDATPPAGLRHCRNPGCAKTLPDRPATGRWPRYCSHACRQAAYRTRLAGQAAKRGVDEATSDTKEEPL